MFEKIYNVKESIIPNHFCDKIIKDGELKTIEKAGIADGNNANRSSKISWLKDKDLQNSLIGRGKEQLKTFDSPQERARKYIELCAKISKDG